MRNLITSAVIFVLAMSVYSCQQKEQTDDEKAQPLLENIEASVQRKDYQAALDSISSLRHEYPKAVESRKRALELWNEASLLKAQHDVATADSALQATLAEIDKAPTLLKQNQLRNKRDSLQSQYDLACGLVRIIKAKQNGK